MTALTLTDQIRSRLIDLGDAGVDGTEEEQAIGAATEISALSAAVDAVLDLHTRDEYGDCSVCFNAIEESLPYPCPTVSAVATALGVVAAPAAGTEVRG